MNRNQKPKTQFQTGDSFHGFDVDDLTATLYSIVDDECVLMPMTGDALVETQALIDRIHLHNITENRQYAEAKRRVRTLLEAKRDELKPLVQAYNATLTRKQHPINLKKLNSKGKLTLLIQCFGEQCPDYLPQCLGELETYTPQSVPIPTTLIETPINHLYDAGTIPIVDAAIELLCQALKNPDITVAYLMDHPELMDVLEDTIEAEEEWADAERQINLLNDDDAD